MCADFEWPGRQVNRSTRGRRRSYAHERNTHRGKVLEGVPGDVFDAKSREFQLPRAVSGTLPCAGETRIRGASLPPSVKELGVVAEVFGVGDGERAAPASQHLPGLIRQKTPTCDWRRTKVYLLHNLTDLSNLKPGYLHEGWLTSRSCLGGNGKE